MSIVDPRIVDGLALVDEGDRQTGHDFAHRRHHLYGRGHRLFRAAAERPDPRITELAGLAVAADEHRRAGRVANAAEAAEAGRVAAVLGRALLGVEDDAPSPASPAPRAVRVVAEREARGVEGTSAS